MNVPASRFLIEVRNRQVLISEPSDPSAKVAVDQAVFDSYRKLHEGAYEGTIVAIHGLPQDIAHILPQRMLRDLGVGTHMTSAYRPKGTARRMRATAEGISKASHD